MASEMAMRPIIGVTGYLDRVRWDIWDTEATVVQQAYIDAIARCGGRAVILPPDDIDADIVHHLDGLLLCAGPDIDPSIYHQLRHPATESPQPRRDCGELLILGEARARGLPVLGVCRGMQLLAVEAGGSLHQHLPDSLGHAGHCEHFTDMSYHALSTRPGSVVRRAFGSKTSVNSHHHQGVAATGSLRATGFTDDGLVEAVEDPAALFVVGVQWHPELQGGHLLFGEFVAAASRFRAR